MNLALISSFVFMLLYYVFSLEGSYGSAFIMFTLTMVAMVFVIFKAGTKKIPRYLKLVK